MRQLTVRHMVAIAQSVAMVRRIQKRATDDCGPNKHFFSLAWRERE
jgi:hypothetical protein